MQTQLKEMIMGLEGIGINRGDVLFVHSSLSALGWVEGGSKTVIDALLFTIGSQGTLLMPAFSYATTTLYPYYFSVKNSVCCVGRIPEYFRGMENTLRSENPTHSVSGCGLRVQELLGSHSMDVTPVGKYSPLSLLTKCKGKILFLGCGLNSNTMMHGVEEEAGVPYVLKQHSVEYTIETSDRQMKKLAYFQHNFSGYKQCYSRLEHIISPEFIHKGKVLEAGCILLDAEESWRVALEKMKTDPYYFVEGVNN